jgi:hypothetical protein
MAGLSDYSADNLLNYIVGKTAMPTLPTVYVALFTAVGTDAGTGFTEVASGGTSYARAATTGSTWNAASGSAPSTISNSGTITFNTATSGWGTVIAYGLYDASGYGAGNLLEWDFLGNYVWKPFTCTAVGTGAGTVVTVPAHGYANGDPIVFDQEFGGNFPTFTQGNFTGTCTATGVTTDTFTVLSSGALAVWTSTSGSGNVRKITQQSVPTGVQMSFPGGAPGNLVITAA